MIKAVLIKPLNGKPAGATDEFNKQDFDYLEGLGAVRRADPASKAAPAVSNKKAPPVANKAK
jgi:hypothetical protein